MKRFVVMLAVAMIVTLQATGALHSQELQDGRTTTENREEKAKAGHRFLKQHLPRRAIFERQGPFDQQSVEQTITSYSVRGICESHLIGVVEGSPADHMLPWDTEVPSISVRGNEVLLSVRRNADRTATDILQFDEAATAAAAADALQSIRAICVFEPRYALIVANGAYQPDPLINPPNDAETMRAALEGLAFHVTVVPDANRGEMLQAIHAFRNTVSVAGKGATALFFYAGHGVQSGGVNYLIPVGASIASEADLDTEAVPVDAILNQLNDTGAATKILILDACRNFPLARSVRGGERGLARMKSPNNTFIAFSTAPGEVASDGSGPNSPFVTALASAISLPEDVTGVFREVRSQVYRATNGEQTPWDHSSLFHPFRFNYMGIEGGDDFLDQTPEESSAQ